MKQLMDGIALAFVVVVAGVVVGSLASDYIDRWSREAGWRALNDAMFDRALYSHIGRSSPESGRIPGLSGGR